MKRGVRKKAQSPIGMSFGMIFSVILIIFFIVVAFIAIRYFLDLKKCTQVGMFLEDLQNDVDRAWKLERASNDFSVSLPSSLDYVCFVNVSDSIHGDYQEEYEEVDFYSFDSFNLFFSPLKESCDISTATIENLDLDWITSTDNPNCFQVSKGKIEFRIEKERGNYLVRLV